MKNTLKNIICLFLITSILLGQEWHSSIVFYDSNGKLNYSTDIEQNKIPDFSYAGYQNGNIKLPDLPIIKTITPIQGDNTDNINLAILSASLENSTSENGFKGALLLKAGVYEVAGTINLSSSGIILRGEGDGDDTLSNTIIKAIGDNPHQRSVMVIGGGELTSWSKQVANSKSFITTDFVPVGSYSFEVEDGSKYNIGDNIIIYHPCTEEWLSAIDYGGTHSDSPNAEPGIDVPWKIGSQPIVFNRNITNIEGNKITIDVPVYNHLNKSLSKSYIYKYNSVNLRRNIGVENIRIKIKTNSNPEDENHAWTAFDFVQIEDGWAINCTATGFGLSGFRTSTATRITIDNCKALDPVSIITGGRRYNFNTYTASQQILVKNCYAANGRHHYMSNGMSWTSGIVFYNCTSSGAYASSEGHRRWSMGILWDNLNELDGPRIGFNPRLLGLYNRGYYGTSHGWAVAHSVAWNCNVNNGDLIVQKPPTAQNYAIGCFGKNISGSGESTFDEPEGYIEGNNRLQLKPASLYKAQYNERHNITGIEITTHEYGKYDSFLLKQNYPNPFNNSTEIQITILKNTKYDLSVYNILGEKVSTIFKGNIPEGNYSFTFNASNLTSGIYYYILKNNFKTELKKMIYLS